MSYLGSPDPPGALIRGSRAPRSSWAPKPSKYLIRPRPPYIVPRVFGTARRGLTTPPGHHFFLKPYRTVPFAGQPGLVFGQLVPKGSRPAGPRLAGPAYPCSGSFSLKPSPRASAGAVPCASKQLTTVPSAHRLQLKLKLVPGSEVQTQTTSQSTD